MVWLPLRITRSTLCQRTARDSTVRSTSAPWRWRSATVSNTLGLAPVTSFVVPRPRAAGTDAVRAFLAGHPAVTAVAAFDDDAAIRTLTALQDLGLSAPGDLAVIGFDDVIVRDSA
jgi:DNA-binding LacI/PurR family transcriptional regulator